MTKSLETRLTMLERRNTALEQRLELLEGGRPGRKKLPIVASIDGVCGVDPLRDSTTCPDASLYRRQQGCKGTACKAKATEYYSEYRKANAPTKVVSPTRRTIKKRAAAKAS